MNFNRVSSMLAALVLILGLANTEEGDIGNLVEECKFRGNMCEVNGSCIERLRENRLVENCDTLPNAPKKSLYIEESLSFKPHPFTSDHSLAKNWTYSIFISDDMSWKNLQLIGGCCNMKGNDKCLMPATLDKDKTFFVVFPYKDSERKRYCWSIVHYGDAPMDVCSDDGSDIIHPCISFQDGTLKIKTRYQPLGKTISKSFDRCYFTVPNQEIQANNNTKFEELFLHHNVKVSPDVENECPTHPIVRIHTTNYKCEIQKNINEEENEKLISGRYNKGNGDFVCHAIKLPQTVFYLSSGVFCTQMPIVTSSPPILPIAGSASATFVFIISVALLMIYRIVRQFKKKLKIPDILGIVRGDLNENRTDAPMNSEPTLLNEVYFGIGQDRDDSTSITEPKLPFQVDVDGDTSRTVENLPAQDETPQGDQQQNLLPETFPSNESISEPTSSYRRKSNGYTPKPHTITSANLLSHEDQGNLTREMIKVNIKMSDVTFCRGYTSKYDA